MSSAEALLRESSSFCEWAQGSLAPLRPHLLRLALPVLLHACLAALLEPDDGGDSEKFDGSGAVAGEDVSARGLLARFAPLFAGQAGAAPLFAALTALPPPSAPSERLIS